MRALIVSRLLVAALALGGAGAAFAANLGPDDRQVSFTGPIGSTESDAVTPALAFDPIHQRHLLVWSADEDDGSFRIHGRLLSGTGAADVSPVFTISTPGPGNTDARQPTVAFAPELGHYLVVWSGDSQHAGAYEIMGQVVSADGVLLGSEQRYSDMGSNDLDPAFDAVTPDVAWHPVLGAFVVVWAADDDLGDLNDGRFEVYGQLVDGATGFDTGANDFRITYSLADPAGNDVLEPSVAVIPGADRWFVAFEADVDDNGVHDPEIWMYGVTGDDPDPSAVNLSVMGGGIFDNVGARHPDLAWVPSSGELVCVWDGEDGALLAPAIFGQRLLSNGILLGGRFPVSGGAGTPYGDLREASHPVIMVDPVTDKWFVAWRGDLNDGVTHHDTEVWARRFDDSGAPIDPAAFMLSGMDPLLGPVAGAGAPAVSINTVHGYKLVAWSGDQAATSGDEHEIFVQGWSDDGITAVEGPPAPAFALHGAAPNPFNPTTTIAFDLPAAAPVSLRIFDASGRLVRALLTESPSVAGRNEATWDGRDGTGRQVASGLYLYRLQTPGHEAMGRITLMK